MGGFGSGRGNRWQPDTKGEVEDHLKLRVFDLYRAGRFGWSQAYHVADEPGLVWQAGKWMQCGGREEVPLEWTPCNFGGERPWFLCPGDVEENGKARKCGRRCGVLYYVPSLNRYRCRSCLNLAYSSQKERNASRALRRAYHNRVKLGAWLSNSQYPIPTRPKGMHRKTYEKIAATIERDEKYGRAWWNAHVQDIAASTRKFVQQSEKRFPSTAGE